METLIEKMEELNTCQKGIVDNLCLSGTGFDVSKHIPVFIKFKNGGPTSSKRYIYYLDSSIEEFINQKELIGEYVVVPVGFNNDFTVGVITHTISTISKKHFNKDIIVDNIDKQFIIRPILAVLGNEKEKDTLIGSYIEALENEKRKTSLKLLIEKQAKEAARNKELTELAEYDDKLKTMLNQLNGDD